MVDWWRGSLEVGGVELVEVLSKAPPEGMTQQQELTSARCRLKLSTQSDSFSKPGHLFAVSVDLFGSQVQRAFKHVDGSWWVASCSG